MDVKTLVARYPRLYHMAERDTWPSIRDRGLLSTSAVLDKFSVIAAHVIEVRRMKAREVLGPLPLR